MNDTELILISEAVTGTDELAQEITNETRVPVLATENPVSRSEFFAAGRIGIRPDFVFIIHPDEYSGETRAEITRDGKTIGLKIYRTYIRRPDEMELYCSDVAGANVQPPEETSNVTN